jgi:hypothetical protein
MHTDVAKDCRKPVGQEIVPHHTLRKRVCAFLKWERWCKAHSMAELLVHRLFAVLPHADVHFFSTQSEF